MANTRLMDPETKRDYMLTTPMTRLIPAMAIPTIASMMISSVYSLADTYFVSQLGTNATGAVGINSGLDNIITMAGSFIAAGAASYISRLLGAKKDEHANRVASTAFFSCLITGTLILILGLLFADPLVRLLGAKDPEVLSFALDYAQYVFFAAPFMASTFILVNCLRAEGSSTLAMIGLSTSAVLNIILDPIFIFTLDLGVKGASLATAISKLVSFCVMLIPFLRRRTLLHIHPKYISYTRDVVPEVLKMGSPSLFRTGLNTLSAIVLNNIAAGYSASTLAAISVCNRIMMLPFSVCLGLGQGYQPVNGFSVGARRWDRVKKGFRTASFMSVGSMLVISAFCFLFTKQVIGLFTEADEQLLKIGIFDLRLQCAALPLHAWVVIVNFFCVSSGKAVSGSLLSMSRQGLCFFPILPIMTALWGEWGVAALQAAADALTLFIAVPIMIRAYREIRRCEAEDAAAGKAAPIQGQ